MHMIFINPPSPFLVSDKAAPALGLLYLAAEVRDAGHTCQFWDMTGDDYLARQFGCDGDTFVQRSHVTLPGWIENQPDDTVFGLTATSAQYESALNIQMALRWHNPHWRIILGGPHASALPDECLRDGWYAVFSGEADTALPAWLDGGLVGGHVSCPAPRELDKLPFPARDLVDLKSYCANLAVYQGDWATTAMHSRGCPY